MASDDNKDYVRTEGYKKLRSMISADKRVPPANKLRDTQMEYSKDISDLVPR